MKLIIGFGDVDFYIEIASHKLFRPKVRSLLSGFHLTAPKEITKLVEKFERNQAEYESSTYNEMHTRMEFINPFFKALGWDMYNEQGFSEAHKEVLYGSSLDLESITLTPDYTFRIEGKIKFLVEAKKPAVNLCRRAEPARQLRSYAWSAKLPVSIITNFKEFSIYDCSYPLKETDDADIARIIYLEYKEYARCWDWISSKISRTAIQEGCLDNPEETQNWNKELNSLIVKSRIAERISAHERQRLTGY